MPTHSRYDPSPSEIREQCRMIQAGWSPSDERLRRTGLTKDEIEQLPFTIPTDVKHEDLFSDDRPDTSWNWF